MGGEKAPLRDGDRTRTLAQRTDLRSAPFTIITELIIFYVTPHCSRPLKNADVFEWPALVS